MIVSRSGTGLSPDVLSELQDCRKLQVSLHVGRANYMGCGMAHSILAAAVQ